VFGGSSLFTFLVGLSLVIRQWRQHERVDSVMLKEHGLEVQCEDDDDEDVQSPASIDDSTDDDDSVDEHLVPLL
jgi:hypothetical protein